MSFFPKIVLSNENSFAAGLIWLVLLLEIAGRLPWPIGISLADVFAGKISELAEQHRVSMANVHLAIGSWTKELEDFRKGLAKPRTAAVAA